MPRSTCGRAVPGGDDAGFARELYRKSMSPYCPVPISRATPRASIRPGLHPYRTGRWIGACVEARRIVGLWRKTMKKWLFLFICFSLPRPRPRSNPPPTHAENILQDEDLEIIHSEVLADGVVDILFGVTVTDFDYMRVVEKLRKHPDIKDVIGRTSPRTFCNFN
jgi:hypothetical protein